MNRRPTRPARPARAARSIGRVLVAAAALLAACGGAGGGGGAAGSPADDPTIDLARGRQLFEANCAACHGIDANGTDEGPPFLHPVYEPNHHGDESFQRAAANGVRAHHWDFGDMPPIGAQNGLTREDVAQIVAYVRSLQREVGIG